MQRVLRRIATIASRGKLYNNPTNFTLIVGTIVSAIVGQTIPRNIVTWPRIAERVRVFRPPAKGCVPATVVRWNENARRRTIFHRARGIPVLRTRWTRSTIPEKTGKKYTPLRTASFLARRKSSTNYPNIKRITHRRAAKRPSYIDDGSR